MCVRQGSLAACGSRAGNVYMVELSHSLTASDKSDKGLMTVVSMRAAALARAHRPLGPARR